MHRLHRPDAALRERRPDPNSRRRGGGSPKPLRGGPRVSDPARGERNESGRCHGLTAYRGGVLWDNLNEIAVDHGCVGFGVTCLLYTSDAADDLLCVDLGGRRIIKKK